ncbi:fam-m protein [Plasmodium malariae]|uniref:Fam-m protein n=1 Tax=Plasmodium malariae TaxID=5858 RepID=A0A1D3P9X5_PLAMA|nr:fam-m protein [Plasmodium malariae]SCN12012.1 fam-m protein [Plasmodium malariae]
MEHKIKLFLFIKIYAFIGLTWICGLRNNGEYNKYFDGNYNIDRKLGIRKYRLLEKYKLEKDSNIALLKGNSLNNERCKKNYVSNSEKWANEKNKKINRNLLNKAQYYTEVVDYDSGMFDGKHFHFEKKWIKKKNYNNLVERNRRICDIALKKIKFRSYGFGVTQFFIFLLFGVGLAVLPTFDFWSSVEAKIKESSLLGTLYSALKNLEKYEQFYIYVALFSLIMIMLSVMLIIGIYKILRNNEKYNKIKLMTE